ncbi:MAG: OmpA family protein [Bacteroidales bacterium]|nr:OmpA family protein [Bacteroidales bacterium]
MRKTVLLLSTVILLSSCVTSKKYDALSLENKKNSENLEDCRRENETLSLTVKSLRQDIDTKNKYIEDLTTGDKKSSDIIKSLNKENADLKSQLEAANMKINEVVNDKSEHLTELSDVLYKREQELNQKEYTLDSLQNEFWENQKQMKLLKSQLAGKDAQLQKIQSTLKDALLGFADKGLSIENKNGKVYVLMEEKLLFQSGKWDVSEEGKKALKEIAAVLAKNTDIDVMVEGHTDNVPLVGKNQIKDNWDLSVMRATSITKILLDGTKINPNRIIPCGRGEYSPQVNNKTPENRAKNRRTEIILSPKVSELMDILK